MTFKKRGLEIRHHKSKRADHILRWKGKGSTAALWSNFIDCVKSRQRPLSPVDVGMQVQAPLSMAMLCYMQNKVARFDAEKKEIVL